MSWFKSIAAKILGKNYYALRRIRVERRNSRGIASFGQEGEDRVLASLLFKLHGGRLPDTGFYVDVGAHDPFLYSNTNFFYHRGWHGLNIDAAPGSMRTFQRHRPRDINLELGIGQQSRIAIFYEFDEPALSTFNADLADERKRALRKFRREVEVKIKPLCDVFADHIAPKQRIDFITIDVEGLDFEVLKSSNWDQYRPMIVLVEIYGKSLLETAHDLITIYLEDKKYTMYCKTVNTAFFVDNTLPILVNFL